MLIHLISAAFLLTCVTAVAASEPARIPARMKVVPIEQAKFVPVAPSRPDGPQMAVLWGDPAQGPSAMLLKMKKGAGPLHWHTSDYHLVVLQGRMKHWGEGETEALAPELGPGSYWFQPGRGLHGDACLSDECVMQIVWSGKRDGHLPPVPAISAKE
jgi:quercetin dioxygenase-like cupin family protein